MAVVFKEVRKQYAGAVALAGVSAELVAGQVTAIVGRSGSGKSTLLKTINGLVRPEQGRVEVFGEAVDYGDLPTLRRRIGYMVQGGGLFPHLSAADNISLLARLEKWDEVKVRQRLHELLEMVRLPQELAARYPHELSGGQQQRVALARAMMLEPQLLLLDESFAALDPLTRLEVHEELLRLQAQQPRTTVMVTHDMREALKLADCLLLLEQGQIVGQHKTAELVDAHSGLQPEKLMLRLLEDGEVTA